MKIYEQLLTYPGGENCNFIDHRDKARLLDFLKSEDWPKLGFELKEGMTHQPVAFTHENVMERLLKDLKFAESKAENERGISASLMFDVLKMWGWVLDDEEVWKWEEYDSYGWPLIRHMKAKYAKPSSTT